MDCSLHTCTDVKSNAYDCVILVTNDDTQLAGTSLSFLGSAVKFAAETDKTVSDQVTVLRVDELHGKRLVFAPTGPITRDYDDVRRFGEAAFKAVKRALAMDCKNLLLIEPGCETYKNARLVSVLGALHALYVPVEVKESVPSRARKADSLGVWCSKSDKSDSDVVKLASALESGRIAARDIGGSDPERMAPPRVAEYVQNLFKGSSVKVNVIADEETFTNKYPLFAAVNRAARGISRHTGRIIKLEYEGEGPIDTTLMLVGKGVTYDTGGADIKAGGVMAGMHRDKCGSAAVAGFFQTLNMLKPKGIKAIGAMSMVRNSVGADCYVADEIITSRAGVRVRIGNTDAEGRMAMADVLCEMKEKAVSETNPYLFTIATLTGHAVRAMGPAYSIVMDNGPAQKDVVSHKLFKAGEDIADPFEISTIRREDYEFNKAPSEYEDVVQANNLPSTMTNRGHQVPAAFMIVASGLDKHGIDSEKPIRYSHCDIAGSSGPYPGIPTGAPILAFVNAFVLNRN